MRPQGNPSGHNVDWLCITRWLRFWEVSQEWYNVDVEVGGAFPLRSELNGVGAWN